MADIREAGFGVTTTNVTVTTTDEIEAVQAEAVKVTRATMRALVVAIITLTTGAGTSAVTPRIRRGTTVAGDLVGEANARTAAAAATITLVHAATETLAGIDEATYIASVEQTGASGNGTVLAAEVIVLLF